MGCGCADCLTKTQIQNLINATLPSVNDGDFGGYSAAWNFSNSTASGPSSTYLNFDNGTLASVTKIYVADTDLNSNNQTTFLDSFTNGSDYGKVLLFEEYAPENFWMGTITGVTDNGSDFTIDVTYINHANSFSADDNVVMTFVPAGADGSNGTDGTDGSTVVYSDISDTAIGSDSETEVKAYDFSGDADILASNGDELHLDIVFQTTGTGGKSVDLYIGDFAGSNQHIFTRDSTSDSSLATSSRTGLLNLKVKRIDGTNISIELRYQFFQNTGSTAVASSATTFVDNSMYRQITADLSTLRQIQLTATGANSEITGKEITARHYQI